MKRLVYLVLKQSPDVFHVLESIQEDGYNGTIISSESLKRAIEEPPEEKHFFSLRQVEELSLQQSQSLLCLFVVDEDKADHLKDVIRENTGNFVKAHGFMFSRPLDDYEGSI